MQHDHIPKSLIVASDPPPKSTLVDRTQAFKTKIQFDMFHIYYSCLHANFQQKILSTALVIAKFKYLTFDPIYRHWAIMVYSEKLLNIALRDVKITHTKKTQKKSEKL